jgi:hypothetical protein
MRIRGRRADANKTLRRRRRCGVARRDYKRFADNTIEVGRRVIFQATDGSVKP